MGHVRVVRRIAAPAAAVWSLLSWRGMEALIGAGLFTSVTFDDGTDEVGATKTIRMEGALPIRERLEWLDAPGMGYGYRIVDFGSLSLAEYVGTVRITPCGPNACAALIRHDFTTIDLPEADWAAQWSAMETGILAAVAARTESAEHD